MRNKERNEVQSPIGTDKPPIQGMLTLKRGLFFHEDTKIHPEILS
jgi:hypothetical protein